MTKVYDSIDDILAEEEWEYGDILEVSNEDEQDEQDDCVGCIRFDSEYGCQCEDDCDACPECPNEIEAGLYMYVDNDEFISVEDMGIGDAIEVLRAGHKVARAGWNGKGMYLLMVNPEDYSVDCSVVCSSHVPLLPWIGMKTADGCFVPWLCSQTDLLAEDYQYVV